MRPKLVTEPITGCRWMATRPSLVLLAWLPLGVALAALAFGVWVGRASWGVW